MTPTQVRSSSASASIPDRSSIPPIMMSSSSSFSKRVASSSYQRRALCTNRIDGHSARADAFSRIDGNKHDMREDLSEGPHLSYDLFRGSASRNLSIIGEKNMETENERDKERNRQRRNVHMSDHYNENFDREKTKSVSRDSGLNFTYSKNRLNVHSNTNPTSVDYIGSSPPFSSSSTVSSPFRINTTPSKSVFSTTSASSASSFYLASSSLSSSSSFYPSTSSLSSSGYPSSPFPISNYPFRSISAPSSFPSSSSSSNSISLISSSLPGKTIYDMTTIDDSDDENEEEKQKRGRVIDLIKSLTQLTDKQQMIKQILEKYQVNRIFSNIN